MTPTSRAWKRAAIVFGIWTAVGLFRALERWTIDPVSTTRLEFGFREALSQNLLFSYIWAAFTPLVSRLARRFPIAGRPIAGTVAVHLGASALLATAHGTLFALAYPRLMGVPFNFLHQMKGIPSILTIFLLANVLTYWGVVGICWTIEALRLSRERELRASQLEAQLAARALRVPVVFTLHGAPDGLAHVDDLVRRATAAPPRAR